jgi:hypothetical protein
LNIKNWIVQEPKTKRSRRTIPLTKKIINDLREHQIKQKQEKLKALTVGALQAWKKQQDYVMIWRDHGQMSLGMLLATILPLQ